MSLIHVRSMGRRLPTLNISRALVSRYRCEPFPSWRAVSTASPPPKLDLPALDRKWRAEWDRLKRESTHDGAAKDEKFRYILPMFPYPSGRLHIGHLRVYTVADVLARFYTLQSSKAVLPMGWDSFGLPAENAALQRGVNPATWTKDNIAKMKEQLQVMNGSWDWSRVRSCPGAAFLERLADVFGDIGNFNVRPRVL